jgi:hypothetical protein
MKNLIIKVGQFDLRELSITNSEAGHLKSYYAGQLQQALDFGWGKFGSANAMVRQPITMNKACRVISRFYATKNLQGSYIRVEVNEGDKYQFLFGHVQNMPAEGTQIPAGGKICEIGSYANNKGFAIHLHASVQKNGLSFRLRDIALIPLIDYNKIMDISITQEQIEQIKKLRPDVVQAYPGDISKWVSGFIVMEFIDKQQKVVEQAQIALDLTKSIEGYQKTIKELRAELEALRFQITACGVSLDGYKEKYSQEMIKNEMIIVEKNEKIHSLEKKIAEYKEKGVESLSWSELLLMAFNKLLKKRIVEES